MDKPRAPSASELEDYANSLKHVETEVKNPLPTKEDIEAEKKDAGWAWQSPPLFEKSMADGMPWAPQFDLTEPMGFA